MAKRRGSSSDEHEWKSYSPVMMRLRSIPFVSSESVKAERPVDLTVQSESAITKKEKADREWKLWLVSDRPERVKHQKTNFLEQCKLDYERLKKK